MFCCCCLSEVLELEMRSETVDQSMRGRLRSTGSNSPARRVLVSSTSALAAAGCELSRRRRGRRDGVAVGRRGNVVGDGRFSSTLPKRSRAYSSASGSEDGRKGTRGRTNGDGACDSGLPVRAGLVRADGGHVGRWAVVWSTRALAAHTSLNSERQAEETAASASVDGDERREKGTHVVGFVEGERFQGAGRHLSTEDGEDQVLVCRLGRSERRSRRKGKRTSVLVETMGVPWMVV